MNHKALEALNTAIMAGCVLSVRSKPGAVIEKLRLETREQLQKLTSDDLTKMRIDPRTFAN